MSVADNRQGSRIISPFLHRGVWGAALRPHHPTRHREHIQASTTNSKQNEKPSSAENFDRTIVTAQVIKMGSTDVPPSTAPTWLIPAQTIILGFGVAFWLLTYVLMVRRSLATNATAQPIIPLGLNLAWEVVWAFYVTDIPLELLGFGAWLLFDIPVVYATLKTAPNSFSAQPLVARNVRLILGLVFLMGVAANGYFAWWWLAEPHRGYGLKWGKTWKGQEARDTTELSYWTAGVAQMSFSVGALAMLVQRGHSGGQSYAIW